MIPSRRLVLLVAFLSVPLLLSGLTRTTADVALLANLLLLGVALVDLLISSVPEDVQIERRISDVLSLGADNPAVLQVRNASPYQLQIDLHDDPGPLCTVDRLPQTLELGAGKSGEVTYTVRPSRRGASVMPCVYLRFPTRLACGLASSSDRWRRRSAFIRTLGRCIGMNCWHGRTACRRLACGWCGCRGRGGNLSGCGNIGTAMKSVRWTGRRHRDSDS